MASEQFPFIKPITVPLTNGRFGPFDIYERVGDSIKLYMGRTHVATLQPGGTLDIHERSYPEAIVRLHFIVDGLMPPPAGMTQEQLLRELVRAAATAANQMDVHFRVAYITGMLGGTITTPMWGNILAEAGIGYLAPRPDGDQAS